MSNTVKGYKVFNPDWTCRGFQYEVGKTYEHNGIIELCGSGFHFCVDAENCFRYYRFNSKNKVAEIEAVGLVEIGDDKSVTNKIRIVRELDWLEVLKLVNTGKECTGYKNSGNKNTGDWNLGDENSGSKNSGDKNSGDWNSGSYNSGDWNPGSGNSGHQNSGDENSGDRNSGNWNSGNENSGNRNSGDKNSGDKNSGNWNSGYENSGNRNSGDWNSGRGNTGNWNSGSWNPGYENSGSYNSGSYNSGNNNLGSYNSGDWNLGNGNSGVFCTEEPKIKIFDVQSDMTLLEWRNTEASRILSRNFRQNIWVDLKDMTDEEKEQYPLYETNGGYLKTFSFKEACNNMWDNLTDKEKEIIKNIPNFNKEKFEDITGISI